jgi:hypothetical protein
VAYADDLQIFVASHPADLKISIARIETCILDIQQWLTQHHLVMNPDKTEMIVLGKKSTISKLTNIPDLCIDRQTIKAKQSLRDLGFVLDSHLTIDNQISAACKNSFTYLRIISKQRHYLDKHSTEALVHAFVFSRLFYCASLLYGLTQKQELRIKRVVNYAIRMIEKLNKRDSASHHIIEHKWLSIRDRIKQRIATIVFMVLKHGQPSQLVPLISLQCQQSSESNISTRQSADKTRIQPVRGQTKLGDLAFRAAATEVWNSLPSSIREQSKFSAFWTQLNRHFLREEETL